MSPLNGSTLIYQTVILPFFKKNHGAIDNALSRGKEFAGDAIAKGELKYYDPCDMAQVARVPSYLSVAYD